MPSLPVSDRPGACAAAAVCEAAEECRNDQDAASPLHIRQRPRGGPVATVERGKGGAVADRNRTTCGVLVGDGAGRVLVGQATGSPRWDIPKGLAEEGESWPEAAARELLEETGLRADPAALTALGLHRYLPAKDLALFAWRPAAAPDPAALRCTSMFRGRGGRLVPEFARFALLPWEEALGRMGKNMARVLREIGPARAFPAETAGNGAAAASPRVESRSDAALGE